MQQVKTKPKSFKDYSPIIGKKCTRDILSLAKKLKGARVLHLNSTAYGGGVAEILSNMVPLCRDLGLEMDWKTIEGSPEFFAITKLMHNGLQGMEIPWTKKMRDIYLKQNKLNSESFDGKYDFIIIHDPQPAAIIRYLKQEGKFKKTRFLWRCHIDLSTTFMPVWKFISQFVEEYKIAIFTLPEYVKTSIKVNKLKFIYPSIDPLSIKNRPLAKDLMEYIISRCGVDINRPIMTQVSRFDPWKDPIGVIDAYRIIKKEVRGVQLVMLATMALDDPEGWHYLRKARRRRNKDSDIHLLYYKNGFDNSLEVNSFQSLSKVVFQKSIREGFGLTVTEALWKSTPVIGGNCGGIRHQIKNGVDGYLVNSVPETADKAIYLLKHSEKAENMGKAGKEYVRKNFLITRHIKDYLELFLS